MFTTGIVDSYAIRHDKLKENLQNATFTVNYSLQDKKLTDDVMKTIYVNVLFVHINDVISSMRQNLVNAPCKMIFKYTGGTIPELTNEEAKSGKVFNIHRPIDHNGRGVLTVAECTEILNFLEGKTKTLSFVQGGSLAEQPHSLRSQILTPFVALHLILQMEPKERESCLKSISESEEDRAFAKEGLDLLKDKGSELKEKISELAGTPFEEDKINEFIKVYADHLSAVFQGIRYNKQIELPIGVDILAGIEQLSKIVEEEIEKGDLKKKARVIKHDLDNVMRRLDNCISPLSPEKLEVIKGGMERLDSIFKELNSLKESLHLDMQNELDSASELIRKIRDGVKTNLEESRLLELKDNLVSALQEPFNMIVSVTTGQEK